MANLFEYLKWRGDIPFASDNFTEVDGLLLVAFSYITPSEETIASLPITIYDLNQKLRALKPKDRKNYIRNNKDTHLLEAMANCTRYQNVKIIDFEEKIDHEIETQFAAYALELAPDTTAIVFRGTDHTITGWKEDFNMTFLSETPGQLMSTDYLTKIAQKTSGRIILCGHSKGGNLAIYSSSTCAPAISKRVLNIYNYDGPGFTEEFLCKEQYKSLLDRIHTYLPESSIVGLLLEHEEPYEVVISRNPGITQHEPYSWSVMGGTIDRSPSERNIWSLTMDSAIREWQNQATPEERQSFVNSVFGLLENSDAVTLEDIMSPKTLFAAGKQFSSYTDTEKKLISDILKSFQKAYKASHKETKQTKRTQKKEERESRRNTTKKDW